MSRLGTLFRLAHTETRRAQGTLGFCILSVALGVMAITTIVTLSESMQFAVARQAQQLMGGDLVLSSSQPLEDGVAKQFTEELEQLGARSATSIRFYSMLRRVGADAQPAPATGTRSTQLVRIAATSREYPLRGRIQSEPPEQYNKLAETPSVLVDPGVARTLGLSVGDAVAIGDLTATVRGHFLKTPGSPSARFSMAPYVYLDEKYLAQTGLLEKGSRIRYERVFAFPPGQDPIAWKKEHWSRAQQAQVRLRTFDETGSSLERLSGFLTVVALVTLFLGALGIGTGLQSFLGRKLNSAAILRSVGASPRDVLVVYGMLTLRVASLGGLVGVVLGALLPVVLGQFSQSFGGDFLPVDLRLQPSPTAMLRGFATGLLSAIAFALIPVWNTARVSPLLVLAGTGNSGTQPSTPLRHKSLLFAVIVALMLSVLFVISNAASRGLSFAFGFAIVIAWLTLSGLSKGAIWLARKYSPRLGSFHLRQGIANLHRPGNQTQSVIVAVGMGFLLLGTLLILQRSLQQTLNVGDNQQLPNFFVIEAQQDQVEEIEALLQQATAENVDSSPMISARLGALNGVALDTGALPSSARDRNRADRLRTREYFVSHRPQLVESETVVAGHFWQGKPAKQEVSLDVRVADAIGAELGDTLTLDVQGRPLDALVTSFREIQWLSLRPNAMVLLSPGPIEKAPGMVVFSSRVSSEAHRHKLEQQLLTRFANLTVIDAEQAARSALLVVEKVGRILQLLGLMAVLAGAIVFAGAIASGRFARQRESMLLKVLGASRADLRRILVAEYFCLASLGVSCGWLLSEAVNRFAVKAFFGVPAHPPYTLLSLMAVGVVVLNLAVAAWVGRKVSNSSPLSVLREA